MATYEIPLSPEHQRFAITLAGVEYQLRVTYRDAVEAGWILDINDSSGSPLVCGIPLITGADLLGQLQYLGIGGQLWVATDGDPDAVPTFDNLGTLSHLYFITAD